MTGTSAVERWTRVAWLAAGVLVALPAAALAQSPCPVPLSQPAVTSPGSVLGVLNETRELLNTSQSDPSPLNQGQFIDGMRIAHAVENGALFNDCGTMAGFAGTISVSATSRVPVTDTPAGVPNLGIGPISGSFTIDGAEGRIRGRLNGVLDFVPTNSGVVLCGGPCPFVPASGSWSTHAGRNGSFAGLALVPFPYPPSPTGFAYLDPTGVLGQGQNALVPLTVDDFNKLGQPEAKFIINMFD